MSEPVLDNPHDPHDRLPRAIQGPLLLWWTVGIAMAILMLAFNLVRDRIDFPDTGFFSNYITILTPGGLAFLIILTAGAWYLVRITLRYQPRVPALTMLLRGFGSGALALAVFQSVQLVTRFTELDPQFFLEKTAFMVIFGALCGVLAFGLTACRQGQGWLPGLLAFGGWIILQMLVMWAINR